ncbi:AraC family transcriptional regulator [Paenibacillus sp. TRM 82003]|nr:AraC family transcriptional regulator [Paenibacillus sp. TRM 82003]
MHFDTRDTQLHMLWTSRIDYELNSGVESHQHEDYDQLLLILEGQCLVKWEDREEFVDTGSYCLFPSCMAHEFQFLSPAVTLDFKYRISDESLSEWMRSRNLMGPISPGQLIDFKQWFRLSFDNSLSNRSAMTLRIEAGFKGSLIDLLMSKEANPNYSASILLKSDFPIARYLQEHMTERIHLSEVADHFGYHPHYLIQIFRNHMGVTPIDYLQQLRIEKAKEELEFTNRTISEIADGVDWTLPYFSRLFRERMGLSPMKYRDMMRKAVGKDIRLDEGFENEWRVQQNSVPKN